MTPAESFTAHAATEVSLGDRIASSASWWKEHGPAVAASSLETMRDHYSRMLTDETYRANAKLDAKLTAGAMRKLGLNGDRPPAPAPHKQLVWGELTYTGQGWHFLGDAEDGPLPEYMAPIRSAIAEYETETAEREFLADSAEHTGMSMSEDQYSKGKQQKDTLRRMSEQIAKKLEAVGIDAYRHDEYAIYSYWLHSRTLEKLPAYRRICLNPAVAAQTRAPKLAALEYFLQEHPYCRFWTFTTGRRCVVEEIPERLDWLFYKLRKLNKRLRKRYGVELVFRATEFGSLEADDAGNLTAENKWGSIDRNEAGRPLYHPHAHCVFASQVGYIKPEKWAGIIDFVGKYWQRDGERIHWDAGGMIRNPRECCKYVAKPADILALSDKELELFFYATAWRRLVRPLGPLAEEIRARKEGPTGRRVLVRKKIGREFRWAEVLDHNQHNTETDAEKAALRNLQDAQDFREECERLEHLAAPSEAGALDGGSLTRREFSGEITRIMARIRPAAGPSPLKEPRVIIMSNQVRPDLASVEKHPLVARLWQETVHQWEAGRALLDAAAAAASGISVHTGTLTGLEHAPPKSLDPNLVPSMGPEFTFLG